MLGNLVKAVAKTVEAVDEVVFRPVAEAAGEVVKAVRPDDERRD